MDRIAHLRRVRKWTLIGNGQKGEFLKLSAVIPSQVHVTLLKHGIIDDPLMGKMADNCQWVEQRDWHYETYFSSAALKKYHHPELVMQGLDGPAEVYGNEKLLAKSWSSFVPVSVDLTPFMGSGVLIRVTFPRVAALIPPPSERFESACFGNDRVYLRKMQCSFGWDWAPRLVSCGLWRDVILREAQFPSKFEIYVATKEASTEEALLHVDWELDEIPEALIKWRLISPTKTVIAKGVGAACNTKMELRVAKPCLWWPHGHGAQPLYKFEIDVVRGREVLRNVVTEFGIRKVIWERIPDELGESFTLLVNGRRVFCKGANWVPADPFPSRLAAKDYQALLNAAVGANMNMLRVWGGGIEEPEVFWRTCNRLGIMVLQDFFLACGEYPEGDQKYQEVYEAECESLIRRLRNHPCLVLWSGNNELGMNDDPAGKHPGKILGKISQQLCCKLDSLREYIPTSPHKGETNNSPYYGDSHDSAYYRRETFETGGLMEFREATMAMKNRFLSESVTQGSPCDSTLESFGGREALGNINDEVWRYHTCDNPHKGFDLHHFEMLMTGAERFFGCSDNAKTRWYHSRLLQYECVRIAAESLRSKMYQSSGLLFWMFNDIWPALGWSLVDYYHRPKAGWFAARTGFSGTICSIQSGANGVSVIIVNERDDVREIFCEVAYVNKVGEFCQEGIFKVHLSPNNCSAVTTISSEQLADKQLVTCRIYRKPNFIIDRSTYLLRPPGELRLAPSKIHKKVIRGDSGKNGLLEISASSYTRWIELSGAIIPEDNYFDLWPGEIRRVSFKNVQYASIGVIALQAWNGKLVHQEE